MAWESASIAPTGTSCTSRSSRPASGGYAPIAGRAWTSRWRALAAAIGGRLGRVRRAEDNPSNPRGSPSSDDSAPKGPSPAGPPPISVDGQLATIAADLPADFGVNWGPEPSEPTAAGAGLATSTAVGSDTAAAGRPEASGDPLAEAPQAAWYVRSPAGGQFGPANREVMGTWIAKGRVSPDSLVWREGWRDWREAASVFPNLSGANYVPGMQDILPPEPLEYRPVTASYSASGKGKSGAKVGLIVAGATVAVLIVAAIVLWLCLQPGG